MGGRSDEMFDSLLRDSCSLRTGMLLALSALAKVAEGVSSEGLLGSTSTLVLCGVLGRFRACGDAPVTVALCWLVTESPDTTLALVGAGDIPAVLSILVLSLTDDSTEMGPRPRGRILSVLNTLTMRCASLSLELLACPPLLLASATGVDTVVWVKVEGALGDAFCFWLDCMLIVVATGLLNSFAVVGLCKNPSLIDAAFSTGDFPIDDASHSSLAL